MFCDLPVELVSWIYENLTNPAHFSPIFSAVCPLTLISCLILTPISPTFLSCPKGSDHVAFIPDHNLLSVIHDPSMESPSSAYSYTASYFSSASPQPASFDENTIMSSQRETLPPYLLGLDVSSVEGYVNGCRKLAGDFVRREERRRRLRLQRQEGSNKEGGEGEGVEGGEGQGQGQGEQKAPGPPPLPPPYPPTPDLNRASSLGSTGSGASIQTPEAMVKAFGDIGKALAIIPEPFFDPEFNLADEDVFEMFLVATQQNGEEGDGGGWRVEQMMEQQELLTGYLDLVEVGLLKQIKARSGDFFRETTRFQALKELVGNGCAEVAGMRKQLADIRTRVVDDVIGVPTKHRKRKNLIMVVEKVDAARAVVKGVGKVRGMVEGGSYEEALVELGCLKGMIEKSEVNKLDCLGSTLKNLAEYEKLSASRLCQEFVDGCGCYDRGNVEVNFRLLPKGRVLKETGNLKSVTELYALHLQETIKLTVKTTVAECAVDVNGSTGDSNTTASASTTKSSITSGVTAMSFPQFLSCLEMLFEQILGVLSLSSNVYAFLSTNGIDLPELEGGGAEVSGGKSSSATHS